MTGKGQTFFFGGAGRYYRPQSNTTRCSTSSYRLQYTVLNFRFSADGQPRNDGQQTIIWNDAYLTQAGLNSPSSPAATGPSPRSS